MKVEVFKTNVTNDLTARSIVARIEMIFDDCAANFDLDDCDKILRVVSRKSPIDVMALVQLLKRFGFEAEVLSDDVPEAQQFS